MFKTFLLFLCILSFFGKDASYAADCDHSRGKTDNQLIPDAKFVLTPAASEHVAISALGEVGRRNYRINGTLGFLFGHTNYLKFSGEYLTQKLGYKFSSGKTDQWRHQTAVGMAYQKNFSNRWVNNTDLQGYYSFAPNRTLHRRECEETCNFLRRHIAGSQAGGGAFGLTFIPWKTGLLQGKVNYDHVVYDRKYQHNQHVSGFGGTVNWFQRLGCYVDFAAKAEFRRPFYYFEGLLNWHAPKQWRGFTIGLFGSHTQGRSHLPNNNTAGIQLSYLIGFREKSDDSKTVQKTCIHPGTPFNTALASWVSSPAVYMPEVLAIADQKRTKGTCSSSCIAPTSIPIPDQLVIVFPPGIFDASPYFSDPTGTNPLTYSLLVTPAEYSLDPNTGVITIESGADPNPTPVTITASNACGSTTQTVIITPD